MAPALLVATAGCEQSQPPADYDVITGTVERTRAETGELTIRPRNPWTTGTDEPPLQCLITNDTEIYVDDRFSSFDAIQYGDKVELIGHPDPSPRGERFVVTLAHIERNEPAPPPPDLRPATTQPTQPPKES
jgi:hypothetical protein